MPNYFYDEKTGEGVCLPDVQMNLAGLKFKMEEALRNYIPRKSNVEIDKLVAELTELALLFHTGQIDKH